MLGTLHEPSYRQPWVATIYPIVLLNLIDQMNVPQETITLDSIHPLLAIVRAVICKSLAYNNSDLLREHLCLLSVKTFLENVK